MKSLQVLLCSLLFLNTAFSQTIDTTFGNNGIVVTDLTQSVDALNTMVLQPDGKIVALGFANNSLVLTRYNADGSLDTSFGMGGIVSSNFSYTFNSPLDVGLQADNKIVILGRNSSIMLLARYNTNGTLDAGFGTNGIVSISATISAANLPYCNAMKVLPDGKIMVAGDNQTSQEIFILRYNANGSLDSSFGINGYTVTPVPEPYTALSAKDICTQADGSFLVGAAINNSSGYSDFSLIRYNSDGTLDAGFGTAGFVVTNIGGQASIDSPTTIKQQPDGKIILAGISSANFAVVRYNSNGALDTAFNISGIATLNVGGAYRACSDMLLESNGKIVLAGYIGDDFAAVRYQGNGVPDASFGTNGIFKIDFEASYDYGNVIIRQPDNKIIMGGWTSYFCTDRGFALTRFNLPEGSLSSQEPSTLTDVTCHPNPTNGLINIRMPEVYSEAQVIIRNSLGREVSNSLFYATDKIDVSISGAQGLYCVEVIQSGRGKTHFKIIKE